MQQPGSSPTLPARTRTRRGHPPPHLPYPPHHPRGARHELFTALELPGQPLCYASEFDHLLKAALASHPHTLILDEAQWLSSDQLEYFRYLWDGPDIQLAIIFGGGDGCHTILRNEPMLSSRIFIWQHFTRLTPAKKSKRLSR
ncbi:ATP-binding protein [Streptomyces sp. NPDC002896]|uniref:ATP-binding protein n=1 Tax=Streptomyces sp. NPDC002896 TaxID=3154438 RepID=UPI00333408AE